MRIGVVACRPPSTCHRFHCASDVEAAGVAEVLARRGYVCTVLPAILDTSGVFARAGEGETSAEAQWTR